MGRKDRLGVEWEETHVRSVFVGASDVYSLAVCCLVVQEFLGRGPLDVTDSKGGGKIKQCVLFLVGPGRVPVCGGREVGCVYCNVCIGGTSE